MRAREDHRGSRPRRAARAVVAIALLCCLALAGCGLRSDDGNGGPPSAGPTTAAGEASPSGPVPTSSGARGNRTAPGEIPEIIRDLRGAVTSVEQYWTAQFAANGRSFEPVKEVYPYTPGDGSSCAGTPNAANNAFYCVPDDDISFDSDFVSRRYDALGDALVYYLIGHEYAHAVQARLNIKHQYTIDQELQADCFAGAYLGDQIRAKVLVIEDGDISELLAGLRSVGDPAGTPWFDPRAHGSAEQRIRAFGLGFDDSLDACD
jgi:hypothetical protein